MDASFQLLPGVICVTCGYAGGKVENPSYEQVYTDTTGHAEVVEVEFDPTRLPLEGVLGFFWQLHDPTQADGQGEDLGTRYRSVIYYANEAQRAVADRSRAAEQAALAKPITTEIAPLVKFWRAEPYHQNYFAQHPERAYCTAVIKPKLRKLQSVLSSSSQS
jgi:peptide-methionine (S)-S-oxide reductase